MKTAAEYLVLPYTVILKRDDEGDVIARVQELPGCIAHGKDEAEALRRLKETQLAWIEASLRTGDEIPVPAPEELLPSGRWLQRVPRTLHKRAAKVAKEEGVSLNQFTTSVLAEAVGRREKPAARAVVEPDTPYWHTACQARTKLHSYISATMIQRTKTSQKFLRSLSDTLPARTTLRKTVRETSPSQAGFLSNERRSYVQ